MNEAATKEENFSQLLDFYCREIPEKDVIGIAFPNPKDKKPKSIDGFASDPLYPTARDLEILVLANIIGTPDESIFGKDMVEKLKEVHYNKKGRLIVPKGLTNARMREHLWSVFGKYSNDVVYSLFKGTMKPNGETNASYKIIVNKYQKIKDVFRSYVVDDLMHHLSFGQIASDNPFLTDEGIASLRQFIGNTIRRNLYVLVNHKYREEIKSQHDDGKRRRANSYWKDERTIPKIPSRFGYQTLGGEYGEKNFGGDHLLEYEDEGHRLQDAYFRRDANKFLSMIGDRDKQRKKEDSH